MSLRRNRRAKIVATLGPASSDRDTLRSLFHAGVDVFRLNFSHGSAEDHAVRMAILREIEAETGRPIGVMADLQGPKLRVGAFAQGPVQLQPGQRFRLDLDPRPGNAERVCLPHPRSSPRWRPAPSCCWTTAACACASTPATRPARIPGAGGRTAVRTQGRQRAGRGAADLRAHAQDLRDLDTALALGADWIALSLQRPEDIIEARERIGDRARIIAKLEKPSAVERLDEIIAQADALMVARGDRAWNCRPNRCPRSSARCRRAGKPVIVATQMLESMIESPVPTRAEASDVATAIYDGADAVMLSAESATGKHPQAAVAMMSRIIEGTEADPQYRQLIDASHSPPCRASRTRPRPCCAMRHAAALLKAAAIVCFSSGATSLRAARERPEAPVLSLTPSRRAAADAGGACIPCMWTTWPTSRSPPACAVATQERFCSAGQTLAIIAGMPFGKAGTTNLLRIATA